MYGAEYSTLHVLWNASYLPSALDILLTGFMFESFKAQCLNMSKPSAVMVQAQKRVCSNQNTCVFEPNLITQYNRLLTRPLRLCSTAELWICHPRWMVPINQCFGFPCRGGQHNRGQNSACLSEARVLAIQSAPHSRCRRAATDVWS